MSRVLRTFRSAEDTMTRPGFDGKEGVAGSSPAEGFRRIARTRGYCAESAGCWRVRSREDVDALHSLVTSIGRDFDSFPRGTRVVLSSDGSSSIRRDPENPDRLTVPYGPGNGQVSFRDMSPDARLLEALRRPGSPPREPR